METKKDHFNMAVQVAEFRFGIISPVIQGLYTDGSIVAFCKRVTEGPLTLPDGKVVKYSYKTIEKWISDYRRGGIDALMPKERADKGSTRALSDEAIVEIFRLKEKYPRMNATQIYACLLEKSFIPGNVSVCAVQRFIKKNDLKSARNPNMRDRKAFEEDAFAKMWQADTCHLGYITVYGKKHKVYLIMIIDDHSRLIVGAGLFYNDNAFNFQKVLKRAVATYGIPTKLYVDNGASYSNEQLSLICGAIGTVLIHTKVRDGASKAKIERSFRTLKERWLYTLDIDEIHSLDRFNEMLADYVRNYNTTPHSGIGKARPFDRYLATNDRARRPISLEWLEECFQNRIVRKVRKDATISIDKVYYDCPMQFIDMKVEIRFLPDAMEDAYILYEGDHYPIRITNKNENCRTKRKDPVIDYTKVEAVS